MDILRIKNKYAAVALFLMLSVALQAQDYGALKYMLQKSLKVINSMNTSFSLPGWDLTVC